MFLYICCENNFITYTYKMKNLKNWMLMMVMVFTSVSALSQNKITGVVVDGEFQSGLPGAAIIVKGTLNGASSDMDGKFELNVSEDKGEVVISFIGYQSKTVAFKVGADKKVDLGTVVLAADQNMLDDIVIMGVADVAKDRKTPVAVSTIKAAEIQEKLGSQEFPEILNTTPSVYASQGGGGFGDSKMNIRGFDQKNIAVLVNGMPVNDMEGGSVYWSNWAGAQDVASAVQVQRGLGSSKIAISSVGGTMNILTKTSDMKEGGSLSAGVGNNDYFKGSASYSTGILDSGLSASLLMSYTRGNGYVEGTDFESVAYFLGLGYRSKDSRHNVQFTFTGANQWHNQRSTNPTIADYLKYSEDGKPNRKYNPDYGMYQGEGYSWARNYYNKPVASLNWDYKINDIFTLNTVAYGSWGRGGGNGALGKINGKDQRHEMFKDQNGHIRFDDIAAWNSGKHVADFGADKKMINGAYYSDKNNGFVRRASINSHDWYGTVMNLNAKVNENWNFDIGVDARTYVGYHFQVLDDLLGAPGYVDTSHKTAGSRVVNQTYTSKAPANPWVDWGDRQKVAYDNDGNVKWLGGFGQVEYSKNDLTVFVQGSISNQWFRRIDYMTYDRNSPEGAEKYKTSWKSLSGGSIKGGLNYNINENHNVFVNSGYFSRQPFMNNGVYINNSNDINPNLKNEKIFGLELGYGLRLDNFRANVNLYRTSWKDRIQRIFERDVFGVGSNGTQTPGYANLYGIEQIHMGLEMDFIYNPIDRLDITGSLSWGDWNYKGNVSADFLDEGTNAPIIDPNTNKPMQKTLYLDGVKVGDAPQFILNLGAAYEVLPGLKVDGNFRYNDKFYAAINPNDFGKTDHKGSISLPSFNLFDAGLSYKMHVGKEKKNSVTMRANVNNVFDTTYISYSRTNIHGGDSKANNVNWKGVDTANEVYFGNGRTWNFTLRYNF
ncbi:Outer membrane receptor proteins, mostly Fe transport [Myroides profundi]|uniref:Outer membrane receptor proteins, mostly Fe transport n=2 Tax=Myroides profundi TaxID=480520 RepID=A0AAJ4W196_MYRPR|nr:Outer membrane receptor proteins, mostly Fe transport [Myroides profundi]